MKNKDDSFDRETTLADMSGIERRSVLFPRRNNLPRSSSSAHAASPSEDKPWVEPEKMDRKSRNYYLGGAMAAGAVVALAYIAGFGLLAFLFYLILF